MIEITNNNGQELALIDMESLGDDENIVFAFINRTTGEIREQSVPRSVASARSGYAKRAAKRMQTQNPDNLTPWALVK